MEQSDDDSDFPGTEAVHSAIVAGGMSTVSAQLVPYRLLCCARNSMGTRLSQLETPLANFCLRPRTPIYINIYIPKEEAETTHM